LFICLSGLLLPLLAQASEIGTAAPVWEPPLWSISGFVLMLLSIAVIPLARPHWWEANQNKAFVTAALGIPYGLFVLLNDPGALIRSLHEYEQFLILLASLFVISGGIILHGDIHCRPRNNVVFLAVGAVLASFIGTTGAAMLLIRPLLASNSERKFVKHTVIFFIFLVANVGGCLTPLGDPPLFLGYLRGVPFTWTFRLWHLWLPTSAFLLLLYYLIDTYYWKKESAEAKAWDEAFVIPLKLHGTINFLFLLGVIGSIFFYPQMLKYMIVRLGIPESQAGAIPVRESIMALMAILSWLFTPQDYRRDHHFTFNPILEVAILFLGIFITMIPALILLNLWGPTAPIQHPWHFFWAAGGLSSFLDNAPTYLTFLSLGTGQPVPEGMRSVVLHQGQIKEITLLAISAGAVFMGANTYIGNAPNFMVKAIAEENGIKMPSFFGYMGWSVGILIPTFVALTLVFFM